MNPYRTLAGLGCGCLPGLGSPQAPYRRLAGLGAAYEMAGHVLAEAWPADFDGLGQVLAAIEQQRQIWRALQPAAEAMRFERDRARHDQYHAQVQGLIAPLKAAADGLTRHTDNWKLTADAVIARLQVAERLQDKLLATIRDFTGQLEQAVRNSRAALDAKDTAAAQAWQREAQRLDAQLKELHGSYDEFRAVMRRYFERLDRIRAAHAALLAEARAGLAAVEAAVARFAAAMGLALADESLTLAQRAVDVAERAVAALGNPGAGFLDRFGQATGSAAGIGILLVAGALALSLARH